MSEQAPEHGSSASRLGESLRVAVLGSGSSGNATAVSFGGSAILIDVGFSAKETKRRLELADIPASAVDAIVVTHEHGDHIRGVRVLAKQLDIPVYASPGTRRAGNLDAEVTDPRNLTPGEQVRVGPFDVVAFNMSHDAAEPIGVRFQTADGSSFGLATDTGILTEEILEALAGCQLVGIECNHDIGMLNDGPYPRFLKNRILSAHGHLSNTDAARGIEQLTHDGLQVVAALHLSHTNNAPRHAERALSETFTRLGHDVKIACVAQHRVCMMEIEVPQTGVK